MALLSNGERAKMRGNGCTIPSKVVVYINPTSPVYSHNTTREEFFWFWFLLFFFAWRLACTVLHHRVVGVSRSDLAVESALPQAAPLPYSTVQVSLHISITAIASVQAKE